MIDPISKTILDQIKKAADEGRKAEEERLRASTYWVLCPSCRRKVAKRQILSQGCWACGWKGTEEEIELAKVRGESRFNWISEIDYKTRCPNCGRLVTTQELKEKGCYICGWRG